MENNASRSNGNVRREQMQQKVPYNRRYVEHYKQEEDKKTEKKEEPSKEEKQNNKTESHQMPFGIDLDFLKNLDSDKILIIALLAMIYKDGSNKKLMMALAYLLT